MDFAGAKDAINNAIDAVGDALAGKTKESSDHRIDRVDQCKVVWYQWAIELPTNDKSAFGFKALASFLPEVTLSDRDLAESRAYDVSNHVENLSFSKTLEGAAGTFTFTLYNSLDWVRFMKAGQWLCIYLTGDGDLPLPVEPPQNDSLTLSTFAANHRPGSTAVSPLALPKAPAGKPFAKRRRCVGVIQRVAVRSTTNGDGTVETSYMVSGKDFGAVYEDTELWFNMHNAEENTFSSVLASRIMQHDRTLSSLLSIVHDVFLNPSIMFDPHTASSKLNMFTLRQWILPDLLIKDLGLPSSTKYFGDSPTLKNLNNTLFENATPNFAKGLAGKCWERLKLYSQPEFHELFTELNDSGQPEITFRGIPWALDTKGYPTIAKNFYTYKDLYTNKSQAGDMAASALTALSSFATAFSVPTVAASAPHMDTRTQHRIDITPTQVESYDVGPDQHSRANFFLVDNIQSCTDQINAFALASMVPFPFPFRDENDIKRHGFKPLLVNLTSFNLVTESGRTAFGGKEKAIDSKFIMETNHLLKDFYANAEDMYSGTINLAAGSNAVKLGKVVTTDAAFKGISDMVFYIEGYVDTFNVNADGTCTWAQTLMVTRGLTKKALEGKASTKEGVATKSATFAAFNKNETKL